MEHIFENFLKFRKFFLKKKKHKQYKTLTKLNQFIYIFTLKYIHIHIKNHFTENL